MSDQVRVPVETLRRAAELLLSHVESAEGSEIAIDGDHFWVIDQEQVYNVYDEPSGFTIGQLSECLDNLDAVLDDPSMSTAYALVWLADLMRAVGRAVVR